MGKYINVIHLCLWLVFLSHQNYKPFIWAEKGTYKKEDKGKKIMSDLKKG